MNVNIRHKTGEVLNDTKNLNMKVWYSHVTSVIIRAHSREILNYTNNLNMKESGILVMNVSFNQVFSQLL